MNYINLINRFWQMRREKKISPTEADVYYFLMQECNLRHWENPFECSNKLICATTGINEKTLIDVRNRLQQKGLIEFESGQRKKKSPVYTLLSRKKESKNSCNKVSKPESKTVHLKYKTKLKQNNEDDAAALSPSSFVPPTIQEIKQYCMERQNLIDPENFYYFYQSKGWMVGKQQMKNWRAAVLTWEKRQKQQAVKTHQHPATSYNNNYVPDERFGQ